MITYTWVAKNLKTDDLGFANQMVCMLKGTEDGGESHSSTAYINYGGADYKARADWTDAEIDASAETVRAQLEQNIQTLFEVHAQAAEIAAYKEAHP